MSRDRNRGAFLGMALLVTASLSGLADAQEAVWPAPTYYRTQEVGGQRVFYREAGDRAAPTILLLHGYPSSSHTYRALIPLLSGRFHVVAPDNLGSGYSDKPVLDGGYTFDVLADHTAALMEQLGIDRYAVYMQDFGAPVGFRVMMKHPDRIMAVIAQNANAYLEGIPKDKQTFFNNAQLDRSAENLQALHAFTGPEAIKHQQYLRDVRGREEIMSPDAWTHDSYFLRGADERNIQVQLFQDYKTNLDRYPEWQAFMREQQYPTLLVWGRHDPVFTESGARAYLRDVPDAKLHLLDAGHFAVEEQPVAIAKHVTTFLLDLGLE